MKFTRTAVSLVLLAAFGASVQAQPERTREQVKADLMEAIRTGDVIAAGEGGLKLNEMYPQRYPAKAAPVGKTRAQVQAELTEAIRTGDVLASGEGSLKLNEISPQRYPSTDVASGRTRAQIKAETLEAIRTGDVLSAGENGLKLNEEFPQRYAKARAQAAVQPEKSTSMSAAPGPLVR